MTYDLCVGRKAGVGDKSVESVEAALWVSLFEKGVKANSRSISRHHDVSRLRANTGFTAENGPGSLDSRRNGNTIPGPEYQSSASLMGWS